jgi:hypothetical protein
LIPGAPRAFQAGCRNRIETAIIQTTPPLQKPWDGGYADFQMAGSAYHSANIEDRRHTGGPMKDLLDSPFTPTIVACLIAGLAVGGAARLLRSALLANLAAPVTFLVAYYETYNKIPSFPPVGSTNKIFYIAIAAAAIGVALDLLARGACAAADRGLDCAATIY